MRSVSVKELKDDPGRYLDEVLAGEEVVIEDHNKPVAKIIPFSANGEIEKRGAKSTVKIDGWATHPPPLEEDPLYITDEELEAHVARLAAEGKILSGKGPVPPEFFDEPLAQISTESLVPFISEDRDEE
jgi:prevent-host-death family protein